MAMIGDTISSDTSEYSVKNILGSGSFGTVALCKKKPTNICVALKIIKTKKAINSSKNETKFLHMMRLLGSHRFNIVQWTTSFMAHDKYCLEFEMLDISLNEYIQTYIMKLQEIRPIVQQMAEALFFLKEAGITHADLKPDNIMMVNHVYQPLKVKLIDFGLAHNDPERRIGCQRGTLWYMAPEIMLGAPYNHAIDTWALGCCTAEMLLGSSLFWGNDYAEMLRIIVLVIGHPPDTVMNFGVHTKTYFTNNLADLTRVWSLKSPVDPDRELYPINTLADLLQFTGETDDPAEQRDATMFVDLIIGMLDVNPSNRITPSAILRHPFLTLNHLYSCRYAQRSIRIMKVCPMWWAAEEDAEYLKNSISKDIHAAVTTKTTPTTGGCSRKRSREETETEINPFSPTRKRERR